MVSLEKWMILTLLQKLLKNVRDLGKLIVAKGFENLSKFQLIAQSGHTAHQLQLNCTSIHNLITPILCMSRYSTHTYSKEILKPCRYKVDTILTIR